MTDNDMAQELTERVSRAAAAHETLRIIAGGSKAFLGCRFEGAPVDVSKHRGIVAYEPGELVLSARAGTPIAALEAALAEHGQTLGCEPPHYSPAATIGGTLACNVSGPARPWRGSIRDSVLGIRLINGRGEHLRFGGRVIKNVAGFDVSRLQAGAFGAFGIVTEVSLRLLPQTESAVTVVHELDAHAAVRRMNELAGRPLPLTGAAWHAGRQYLRFAGTAGAVNAACRALGGERMQADIWPALRDHTHEFFRASDAPALWRLSVKSTSPAMLDDPQVLIDWGGALRYVRTNASLAEMSCIAAQAGGHAMRISHNDGKAPFMQDPAPALRRLHERLKAAFDPVGIFNRARLYDWL